MQGLKDKIILLTGASQGIGAATARILGDEGAELIAHYRGQPGDLEGAETALREVSPEHKYFVAGDFEDNAAVEQVWQQAVDWRGSVDVLVLNAAMMDPSGGFDDTGPGLAVREVGLVECPTVAAKLREHGCAREVRAVAAVGIEGAVSAA